jgi:hypothetical protein
MHRHIFGYLDRTDLHNPMDDTEMDGSTYKYYVGSAVLVVANMEQLARACKMANPGLSSHKQEIVSITLVICHHVYCL